MRVLDDLTRETEALGLYPWQEGAEVSFDSYSLGEGWVTASTDKAVLIRVVVFDEEVWIPKAVIHDDSEVWKEGQEPGDIVVMRWYARQNGWCED